MSPKILKFFRKIHIFLFVGNSEIFSTMLLKNTRNSKTFGENVYKNTIISEIPDTTSNNSHGNFKIFNFFYCV